MSEYNQKYANLDRKLLAKYAQENPWGMSVAIDLKECKPEIIRNRKQIKSYVEELCDKIEMKRFGPTIIVDFGEDPRVTGYSMTQLIETSLISGHFANNTNEAYLDLFSCKQFPPYQTALFSKEFFGAKKMKVQVLFR